MNKFILNTISILTCLSLLSCGDEKTGPCPNWTQETIVVGINDKSGVNICGARVIAIKDAKTYEFREPEFASPITNAEETAERYPSNSTNTVCRSGLYLLTNAGGYGYYVVEASAPGYQVIREKTYVGKEMSGSTVCGPKTRSLSLTMYKE